MAGAFLCAGLTGGIGWFGVGLYSYSQYRKAQPGVAVTRFGGTPSMADVSASTPAPATPAQAKEGPLLATALFLLKVVTIFGLLVLSIKWGLPIKTAKFLGVELRFNDAPIQQATSDKVQPTPVPAPTLPPQESPSASPIPKAAELTGTWSESRGGSYQITQRGDSVEVVEVTSIPDPV